MELEQGSPRAASKGVAIMVELYNKNKRSDSMLADVDEQTLASVDDGMFRQSANVATSPPGIVQSSRSGSHTVNEQVCSTVLAHIIVYLICPP